jgi:hypothetical protein
MRESTGNFLQFAGNLASGHIKNHAVSRGYGEIPYPTEQGIFSR